MNPVITLITIRVQILKEPHHTEQKNHLLIIDESKNILFTLYITNKAI